MLQLWSALISGLNVFNFYVNQDGSTVMRGLSLASAVVCALLAVRRNDR